MKTILYLFSFLSLVSFSACNLDDDEASLTQTNPVQEQTSGCERVISCFEKCGTQQSCFERCKNKENADEGAKAVELMVCLNNAKSKCFTSECQMEKCKHFVNMCTGKVQYACGDVINCQEGCSTVECNNRCIELATPAAKTRIDDILVCFGECSDDAECIDRRCTDEITICQKN